MTKPALIIGLGGTGQKVLLKLKKDLLHISQKGMPQNVKLLEIDTSSSMDANAKRNSFMKVTGEGQDTDVSLAPEEFVNIGDDMYPLVEEIRNKRHFQAEWFRGEQWLKDHPSEFYKLNNGTGQLRQFGRLALFKDTLGHDSRSRIWRAFQSSITAIRNGISEDSKLEIIIVGSFAGGTGSRMFIDIALILRLLAQQMGVPHMVHGFFALPGVFTSTPDIDMQARAFAAWRELERFMLVDNFSPMPRIHYVKDNEQFQFRLKQHLFESCFLLDGTWGNKPFSTRTKDEVFSVIADAISIILDQVTGTMASEINFANFTKEHTFQSIVPLHNSIGMFKIHSPVHLIETTEEYQNLFKDMNSKYDPSRTHVFSAETLAAKFELEDLKRNELYKELHPRVVMLLDNLSILEQFIYLYALKKVEAIEADGIFHWELRLRGDVDGVWLTPGWSGAEDNGPVHPKPSLFNAINGFTELKESDAFNLPFLIEVSMIHQLITATIVGKDKSINIIEAEIMWIDQQMRYGGVVDVIRQQAPDPKDGHIRQEYIDLARVAKLILLNRRKKLKERLGLDDETPATTAPF